MNGKHIDYQPPVAPVAQPSWFRELRPAIVSLILFTVITGVIYPLLVTGVAKVAFGRQADGSLITHDGKDVGSELIAQGFTDPKYFWPRPSAASYNGAGGSGSNQGPTNPALAEAVKGRIEALKAADPTNAEPVPVDLVTASGSGLDPHISVAAAQYQASRVARARNIPRGDIEALVAQYTEGRTFGVLGEPRVNVLRLNLALDQAGTAAAAATAQATSMPHHEDDITVYRARGFMPDHH